MEYKFSIVIPLYNDAETIGICLESIYNSSYKDFEVIVVDDKSSDNSAQIAKSLPCKVIEHTQNLGAGQARNTGARHGNYPYLIFTDADIEFFPDTLDNTAKYLGSNKDTDVLLGTFHTEQVYKNLFSQYKHLYLCYYYLKQGKRLHTIDTSYAVIPRELFFKFNGFQKGLRVSEDVELGMRITKAGYHIHQDKNTKIKHLKYYSFKDFVKADFIRSKRMSRLFIKSLFREESQKTKKAFFLKPLNIYISIPLMFAVIAFFIVGAISNKQVMTLFSLTSLILFILFNLEFWIYIGKANGALFAIKSACVTLMDASVMNAGVLLTLTRFLYKKRNL